MSPERLLTHYARIVDAPDAVTRLRGFILDLVVRGKLVPQDPADEPTSEWLEALPRAATQTGRSRGAKGAPSGAPIREADLPFLIPTTWKWVRFDRIAEFSAGRTPSRSESAFWNTGDYAWASIADMADGCVLASTKETISALAKDRIFASAPAPPGTILMSFKLTIGKIARLGVPAFHNEAIISVHPVAPELDAYLFMVLPQCARRGITKNAIKGATLNRESIANILVPLPPIAEQRRIISKVDELMALCDDLEASRTAREAARDRLTTATLARLNQPDPESETFTGHARFALSVLPALTVRAEQVTQLRQTILSLAVRGKLVPQHPNDEPASDLLGRIGAEKARLGLEPHNLRLAQEAHPFELPAGWEWTRVGDVCSKTGSGSTPRGGKAVYKRAGVPFLRSQNIYNDRLRLDDVARIDQETHRKMAGTAVKSGDLLLNITGGSIGRCCWVKGGLGDANVSQHVAILRPALSELSAFVHCAVLSSYFQAFVTGEQTGAGREGLPKNRMDRIPVPLPPLAEQGRIVDRVGKLMALCDQLEGHLSACWEARLRLLDALLAEALAPTATALETTA